MPYAKIARAFLKVGILLWQCQKHTKEHEARSNKRQKKRPPGHRYAEYDHPTEEQHRTTEQIYWQKGFRVNILTWVSAIVAIGFAAKSYQAAIGQIREMRDEQRPWMMLAEIKPTSLASDDEVGVHFWVNLMVKNVGHSPAQNVFVTGKLLLDEFNPFPDQDMLRVCRDAQTWGASGNVFFPDQPPQGVDGETPDSFDIDASVIWAARNKRIASDREGERDPGWKDALVRETSKFPFYDRINFVGCINYQSAGSKILYQTSFIFDLGSFPLLGGVPPEKLPPTPYPGHPDVMMVHGRYLQRIIPGNRIKPSKPLYSTFIR